MKTVIMHKKNEVERNVCTFGGAQRGAALIIALSVLLVLLSIAITFALMVRYESEMSQQGFQAARAENLLDGVLAKAMYRLNHDLEVHPAALSLDHGWRSWFSGAAFVGKNWAREKQGVKSNIGLYFGEQGLVNINIKPVEDFLGYTLYARFFQDNHIEPLFRGPRTESWLHVPRQQGDHILLYAESDEMELVQINNTPALTPVDLVVVNNNFAGAGRPERIFYFSKQPNDPRGPNFDPDAWYPFVMPAFYDAVKGYPQEEENLIGDLDNSGEGNRDSLWMPIAQDLDRFGDYVDNDLDGIPEQKRGEDPLFESAPFVYHGLGMPDPETGALTGDGRNNDSQFTNVSGVDVHVDDPAEDKLFLTVPLPGMVMQIDLNSDGVFDERDYYCDASGNCGPVYARLPNTISVYNTYSGVPASLGINDVDTIDNDYDLITNGYRAYAYVGPHNRVTGANHELLYINNQIPSSRAIDPATGLPTYIYNGWHHFEDPQKLNVPPHFSWAPEDQIDPLFVSAHNRGYHDINVDAVLGGPGNIQIFFVNQNGAANNVSAELENILRADNALHITCSGEPVSQISGRAAVRITDEAGKVNMNVAGGFVLNDPLTPIMQRALNKGVSSFEYETRLLPDMGNVIPSQLWGMRTGAVDPKYAVWPVDLLQDRYLGLTRDPQGRESTHPDYDFDATFINYLNDVSLPGYGLVDDNGNALILSMTGRDDIGLGIPDAGLGLSRLSPSARLMREGLPHVLTNLALEEDASFNPGFRRLGVFEGIDDPAELRMFNPLRNLIAENTGLPFGAHGDRLLLRKEELTKHEDIGENFWDYVRNVVTVNSDTRNTFAKEGHGMSRSYLKIDPNYATAQQLAATLLISGSANNIVEKVFDYGTNPINPWAATLRSTNLALYNRTKGFAEGLRQFDTAFSGAMFGQGFNYNINNPMPPTTNYGARFPADPVLQTMRLAADIVAARERSAARHKLVTENFIRTPDTYANYLRVDVADINYPAENPNERERILEGDLLPVGDIQEYLQDALGITPADKRLISTDSWWKAVTETTDVSGNIVPGEDRLFQFAAASGDAIKINELMVRPVRRVEAETEPIDGSWLYSALFDMTDTDTNLFVTQLVGNNLKPAPHAGMLSFDVSTSIVAPAPVTLPDKPDRIVSNAFGAPYAPWIMRSAYDYWDSTLLKRVAQPLLGESTAWVYEYLPGTDLVPDHWTWIGPNILDPSTVIVNPDIMEFRFRASDGLPPGRYYLTVNITDPYGNMSAVDAHGYDPITGLYDQNSPPILEYSIKYRDATNPTTIAQDVQALMALMATALPGTPEEYLRLINALFQQVDEPEYIASPGAQSQGSACPTGWVFLPPRDMNVDALEAMYAVIARDFCPWIHVTVENAGCNPGQTFFQLMDAAFPLIGFTDTNNPDQCGQELYNALINTTPPIAITFLGLWTFIDTFVNDPVVDTCYSSAAAPIPTYADWRARIDTMSYLFNTGGLRYFLDEAVDGVAPEFPAPTTGQRTYTVIIPPVGQGELCIAFRVKPEAVRDFLAGNVSYSMPPGFAINSFDFSQEPDHEYVELANVTDEEIDLGGWTLEVGIPDPPGATHDPYMKDPFKSKWTIPTGTRIAPQGKLLLGFDVFDGFQGYGGGGSNLVSNNGMGLAASSIAPGLEFVTVPPIGWMPVVVPPYDIYADDTGSVFRRNLDVDFIDNDGDGLSSAIHILDNVLFNLDLDLDNVQEEYRTHGNAAETIPAWSRMVPLINNQLWLENTIFVDYPAKANPYVRSQESRTMADVTDTRTLARLILRGGALPNYPERDGIDNDGDGGYVTSDKMAQWAYAPPEQLLAYVRGTLDKDMVDNDMDGRVDECGVEMFNGMLDGFGNPLFATHGQPLLSEGVDEGHMGRNIRYPNPDDPTGLPLIQSAYRGVYDEVLMPGMRPRMYGCGTYESYLMRVRFVNNPTFYEHWVSLLLGTKDFAPYLISAPYTPDQGFPYWEVLYAGSESGGIMPAVNYTTSPTPDSSDWQQFVERRWNPGDNVMVTLYVGPASDGKVADQVTYREYDVTNRTINDIAASPYHVDGFNGPNAGLSSYSEQIIDPVSGATAIVWKKGDGTVIDQNWERVGLDPQRPMFWLPDHMGLDFYRSLERKHPLYHGDRFGLANRWTPTSAAYDDWAESMSTFLNAYPRWNCELPNFSYPDPANRFVYIISGLPNAAGQRLFAHAFYGSPLRMNTQARIWENPRLLGERFVRPSGNGVDERADIALGVYHQFPGLDRYRDTGHELDLRAFNPAMGDTQPKEMRQASDWSFRQAQLRNLSFETPGNLARLPLLSFERILDYKPADYQIQYYLDCAISPINSQFVFRAPGDQIDSYPQFLSDQFTYFYDSTVTSSVLAQAVEGAGLAAYPLDWNLRERPEEPEPLLADALDAIAMNPIVLTVGQARVAPLWPGPGAEYPVGSGTGMDEATLRDQFKWSGPNNPSHMWTPVYLFDLPDIADPSKMEEPWLVADYPREIGQPAAYSLDNGDGLPLITPTYMFTGRYITNKLFGILNNNQLASIVAPRWPIRSRASIVAVDEDPFSPADRAVMYVSRHTVDMGDANRAEALFVWDRESGIENGTYVAYVGTAIPGLTRKVDEAQLAINADYVATGAAAADQIPLPHALDMGGVWMPSPRTQRLLGLDPAGQHDTGDTRFETQIAMEFITDRRYAEQMQPPPPPWGLGKTDQPGMLHPRDWYPESYTVPKYTAGADGYILYSKDPNMQWQPIPVRVTDNYLALRVRNMGEGSRIACITHVVLAPAPRNRGQINVNTAETHRIVRGATGANWEIELFNALEGLPGVVNALNTFMDPALQPKSDAYLAMPNHTVPKATLPDPWRAPWPMPTDITGGPMPPLMNARPFALSGSTTAPDDVLFDGVEEGAATLNLTSLIAGNRKDHPDGRYYNSPSELLSGIYVGGVDKRDRDGAWPLSNLGRPPLITEVAGDVKNPAALRFEEIIERFGRMSNMVTTRSDVFEIIATVQAGTVTDNNADGVFDYRGDEFFPTNETRARIIYDRRARTIRMDEAREVGQEN